MRNKIIWKFFGTFALLALIAVFVLNFFVSLKLQDHFEQRITQKLRSNAILVGDFIKEDLANNRSETIQNKAKTLANELNLRITIVDIQGKVLADSETAPSLMENHSDRPEIIKAIENGFGQSSRFSDTLNYNMKYVAVGVNEGDELLGIVRFALPDSEVQLQIRIIYRIVLLGAIIAIIIALTVAYFISKSITFPISQMQDVAQRIAKGDFSRKVKIKSKDELGELA
ncbi:MAG: HAMP domain-containing protein, partial [Phycisphaerales bacterium]